MAELALASLVSVLLFLVLLSELRLGQRALLSPVFWASGYLLLLFGLAPLYRHGEPAKQFGLPYALDLSRANTVATLGVVCFVTGLAFRPTCFRSSHSHATNQGSSTFGMKSRRITTGIFVLALIVAVAYAFTMVSFHALTVGGWSSYLAGRTPESSRAATSNYFVAAPVMASGIVGAIMLAVPPEARTRTERLALFSSVISLFLLALPGGGRRFLLSALMLPLLIALGQARHPVRTRTLVWISSVLLLLGSMATVLRSQAYREANGGALTIVTELLKSPATLGDRVLSGNDTEMRDFLAYQIEFTDGRGGFNFGTGLAEEAIYQPFPSAVFGPKPLSDKEELLFDLYGDRCQSSGGFCPDYSIIGSLYRIAGTTSVAIGMFLLGMHLRVVGAWLRRDYIGLAQAHYIVALDVFVGIFIRKGLMEPALYVLFYLVPALLASVAVGGGRLSLVSSGERVRFDLRTHRPPPTSSDECLGST